MLRDENFSVTERLVNRNLGVAVPYRCMMSDRSIDT